jgi:hypothetical protein
MSHFLGGATKRHLTAGLGRDGEQAERVCGSVTGCELRKGVWKFDWEERCGRVQVFGPREEIVGYESPRIEIVYASNSLVPCILFQAASKVEEEQLAELEITATDVYDPIRRSLLELRLSGLRA